MKNKRTPTVRSESQRSTEGAGELVRLNRYLALNGIASRRRADEMIENGDVMVDDEIVTEMGLKIDPAVNRVEVDGVVLRADGERKRYYLLNKPAGVVCTNEKREYRPRAVDMIVDRQKGRIYTVGRLDEDTVGLVILTNDGDFAYRVSHPRYRVMKTYRVTVTGRVDEDSLRKLREGVRLSDFRSHFEKVWIKKRGENRSIIMLHLQEGRNREIRRVFAKLGFPVRDLRRVEIGGISDRGLKVGSWRPMTRDEIAGLIEITREGESSPAASIEKRSRYKGRPVGALGHGPGGNQSPEAVAERQNERNHKERQEREAQREGYSRGRASSGQRPDRGGSSGGRAGAGGRAGSGGRSSTGGRTSSGGRSSSAGRTSSGGRSSGGARSTSSSGRQGSGRSSGSSGSKSGRPQRGGEGQSGGSRHGGTGRSGRGQGSSSRSR